MILWEDAGMVGLNSTHSYNSIVVGFILTTNELVCLTLYEEYIAWFDGVRMDTWLSNNHWKPDVELLQVH